ncbi:MAG: glycosyltransferase [Bacteroidales bacterium]|nr:glycosyltransferase [Bacteroidales bacterium]
MNIFKAKVVSLEKAAELTNAQLHSYKLENTKYYWQQGKFEEKSFTNVYMVLFKKAIVNHIFQIMLPEYSLFIDNETYQDALKWFPMPHNYSEKDNQIYFECPIEKKIVHINEPTFLIGGHSNIWHWLQNWLPRVAIGEHFEEKGILPNFKNMKILVHDNLLPAQTESLLLLGFKEENILFNNGQQFYQFENLYVTSFFHNNAINSFIPKFYKKSFQHILEINNSFPQKIYISRQKEMRRRRRIHNSNELELILEKYNFKTIFCEELSFIEQMLYFYNAEIILGGHGAGLVNILFAKNKTDFILYEYKGLSEYEGLARVKGLVTHRIMSKQYIDREYELENTDLEPRLRDFIVDVEKTETVIRTIINKQILIFSPTPSHPQSAGNRIRIFNLAKYLQKIGNAIHFVYFTQEGLIQEQELEMSEQWNSLTIIKKEKHYKASTPTHYLVDDWYQENIGPIIQEKCKALDIDIVLMNYIFQSKLLEFVPNNIVKIIDTHDRFSDRHIMLQKNGIEPDFFYTVKSEEAKAFDRADIVLAIQDKEADFFRSLTDKRVEVIGHIEEEHFFDREYNTLQKIGFIGSRNSTNLTSLTQFIDKFTQWIDKKNLSIELMIAGSICTKIESTHRSIKLLGFVDDLQDFYSSVDLIVNPLILGTGLKIKSIEALAYGVPIVSTDIGFEGISSTSVFHFADDQNELIEYIDEIYKHPETLGKLALLSKNIFDKNSQDLEESLANTFKTKHQMPSLLFITHINFWERDLGSRMRLYHLLNYLKAYVDITIIYTEKKRDHDIEKLHEIGYEEQVVFLDEVETSEIDEKKINIFLDKHAVLKRFYNALHYKKFQTFIDQNEFDSVIIEYIQFSYFLPLLEGTQCILDTHDIMNIRNKVFKENNQVHWIDISEKEEFSIFREYEKVMCIQKKEHNYLLSHDLDSLLVPYSFPIVKTLKEKKMKNIVFIGGNNLANANAINWFIECVWPTIRKSDLTLEVYGTVCQSVIGHHQELKRDNIYIKGKIDDLNVLYGRKADLIINPVQLGGGLKIKNVEALANGLPLITTPEGANGLEDGINNAFLLANTTEEWIESIIAVMISKDLRKKLSENALDFAKNNFSEKVCYSQLRQILTKGNI